MSSLPKIKLYGYWRSSASWRVRWALELKQLPYENIPVNLLEGAHEKEEHQKRSSLKVVPVLEVEGKGCLQESISILEWLDEEFADRGKRLYPNDSWERAKVRELCEIINSDTAPLQVPRVQKRHSHDPDKRKDWAVHFILRGLKAFEQSSQSCRRKFSFGDTLTAADLCLVPQLYNARRYGIDLENELPDLAEIYKRCLQSPEGRRSSPEEQADAQ